MKRFVQKLDRSKHITPHISLVDADMVQKIAFHLTPDFFDIRDFLNERNSILYFRRRTWKCECPGRKGKVRQGTGRETGLAHAEARLE